MACLLIVDDDAEFAGAIAELLASEGHELIVKEEPEAALTQLAERPVDVVILDVMFPEDPTAGFALARTIRRRYEDLPILMLTAVNQEFPLGFSGKDIHSEWLPVTDFLEKPVDFPVLVQRVNKLLGQ
jgi:DNA-binding response OmpR family regulator